MGCNKSDKEIVESATEGTPNSLHAHFTRTIQKIEKHQREINIHIGELKRYLHLIKESSKKVGKND